MKDKIKNNIPTLTGLAVGILGGFLYWKFVGCATGTCPITSNWGLMLIYGGMLGGLFGNMIHDKINPKKIKNSEANK